MRRPAFPALRLQGRIVAFFVFLLAAVQLASFYFIANAIEDTARNTLREELQIGARVFRRLLEQNSQQLVAATSVLTYDFGFREAIATRDRETILSALRNHSARIRAQGMAVVGLDGIVVADTLDAGSAGQPHRFGGLVARAADKGGVSAIDRVDGQLSQVIVIPVLAPLPIAFVAMRFFIDDATARDLKRLVSSEVTFAEVAQGDASLLATTLPAARQESLRLQLPGIASAGMGGMRVRLDGEDFEALAMALDEQGRPRLLAVLQRSVAAGLAPYRRLQVVLLVIAVVSLAVTLAVAIRIARRIARPLTQLAHAAGEVAHGRYDTPVEAADPPRDEVDELAIAFRGMTRGLAERDNMRDVLGKVASPAVAQQLLGGSLKLGGEERDVTVMFTDIRNFTTLCESLSPQASLALLNEFLTAISEVVEAHEGVVDKYLGDGVMAVFGAPLPLAGHARRAVDAAFAIRQRVAALGPVLAARGLPHPDIGLGLNTARVVAGNIGSPSRLNYTVLGDGVNLASRFEGLTKRYRVPIVAGELTQQACPDVLFRELDRVRVRGRTQPVRIFEPLAHAADAGTRAGRALDTWHAALGDFRARRWDKARTVFERLEVEPGFEHLAHLYLGYLQEIAASPPGADWDAVYTLFEK